MKSSLKSKYSNFYSLMRFEIKKNLQYYHKYFFLNVYYLVNMQIAGETKSSDIYQFYLK